jgi:uncharacterized protein YecE (DUF72 family)
MDLFVGTSGYAYKEWKGKFYPKDLPANRMLHFYGERFRSVEINATFYSMPKAAGLEKWAEAVPPEFKFVLKAPQRITHMQRLKDAGDNVSYFVEVAAVLKERLGPLLFQLPPNMKKDAARLAAFLGLLPATRRVAVEFRNSSWFDEETFGLLRNHGAALCVAEAEDDLETPFVKTADWGYLRLRRADYSDADLKAWLEQIRTHKWKDAFIFFRHEDEANGPRLAQKFLELARSAAA